MGLVLSFLEEKTVLHFGCLFDCGVEGQKHELYHAKKVIQRKTQCRSQPMSILDFTDFLELYKKVFHQLFLLCWIVIALRVSCEDSFSVLKLTKIICEQ